MFLAGSSTSLVHGDVKDLSELGACIRTDTALDSGGVVTINVKNGYSFLFRAEARIVWRARERRPREPFDCAHGILFTELSPFTKKLIRRLGGIEVRRAERPAEAPLEGVVWDSDSDPDLQILFHAERAPARVDEERLDVLENHEAKAPLLADDAATVSLPELDLGSLRRPNRARVDPPTEPSDPCLDAPIADDDAPVERRDAAETALGPEPNVVQAQSGLEGDVELSGNLGYFDSADVLQMLEGRRATGVLYVEGPVSGQIHLLEGRICRCVADELTDEEASYHLVVARVGRFHFVPRPVPENARSIRTTTQLVLEAQLRRDRRDPS
jgi:hypothetical protein